MNARRHRISAPEQNQFRVLELLNRHAHRLAMYRGQSVTAGRGANSRVKSGCAECIKKALRQPIALNKPHGPRIAVGHNTLRIACRNLSETSCNLGDCDCPRHRLKLPRTLRPDSTQRLGQAIRMMGAFRISSHLGAQNAVRRRMIGVPLNPNDAVAADRHPQRAGIRAIMRASRAHRTFLFYGCHLNVRSKMSAVQASAILNRSS